MKPKSCFLCCLLAAAFSFFNIRLAWCEGDPPKEEETMIANKNNPYGIVMRSNPLTKFSLPTIRVVQPTFGKRMALITFLCPSEAMSGTTPIPAKAIHMAADGIFWLINSTNLLDVELQQVCA